MTQSINQPHQPLPFPNPHSVRHTILARWYPGVRLFGCTPLRIAGMLPVIIVLLIHALAYVTAVPGTLLPLYSSLPLPACVLLVVFHLVFLSAVANYLLLVFIDPGSVPADWKAAPPPTMLPRDFQYPQQSQSSPSIAPAQLSRQHIQIPFISPPVDTEQAQHESFRHAHLMQERTVEGFLRYCRICKSYKPDRAHHCSVCKRCILRMDHHCVFVNNCVSFYNHKFFVSFVTYAFLGCVIVAVISFPTFADIIALPNRTSALVDTSPITSLPAPDSWIRFLPHITNPLHSVISFFVTHALSTVVHQDILARLSAARQLSTALKTVVMIGYIVTSAFSFALGVFVTLHFYLVSKGRTTIEMYEMTDPIRAPAVARYDLGFRKNFRSVCGSVPMCWLFPTRAYIDGDGLQYERRGDPPTVEDPSMP